MLLFRVKGLKLAIYNINKYIFISIYIFIIKKNNIKILYRIYKEIYFINNLKVYILLNNNIIGPKKIILDIA